MATAAQHAAVGLKASQTAAGDTHAREAWVEPGSMGRKRKSRPRSWAAQETVRLLSARRRGKTYAQCALMFERTPEQIRGKLRRMGVTSGSSAEGKRQHEIQWSQRELAVLKNHYVALGPSVIAERLGRTARSVSSKATRIGLVPLKPKWCYADLVALLIEREPIRHPTLLSKRSARAMALQKNRLRKLHNASRLETYLKRTPGAPAHCIKFGAHYPPGLKFSGVRLTAKGKSKRAGEYLAREAERERQKAAFKKWQASAPNSKRR